MALHEIPLEQRRDVGGEHALLRHGALRLGLVQSS